MSAAEVLGADAAAMVGKCASCRFSRDGDLFGEGGLHCAHVELENGPERVRAHWTCRNYQYETGSVA